MVAAARTEAWEERSRETNFTWTDGYLDWISEITGVIFDSVRPARMMSDGQPAAILIAVSAPIPPTPGPVMTTGDVSLRYYDLEIANYILVLPFTRSLKAATTSSPVEVNSQRVMSMMVTKYRRGELKD